MDDIIFTRELKNTNTCRNYIISLLNLCKDDRYKKIVTSRILKAQCQKKIPLEDVMQLCYLFETRLEKLYKCDTYSSLVEVIENLLLDKEPELRLVGIFILRLLYSVSLKKTKINKVPYLNLYAGKFRDKLQVVIFKHLDNSLETEILFE